MATETSSSQTGPPQFIPSLDGLRGLAALAVVWFHFPQIGQSRFAACVQDLSQKTLSGQFAVSIFLVLSGFLITRIILREVQEKRFSLRLFLAKRALRIFPIYFLTLAVFACGEGVTSEWVSAACYVSNYTIPFDTSPHPLGHTWSLAVEEQFYLLWPLVFVCLPLSFARRAAWPVGPAIAVSAAALTFALVEANLAWGLVYRALPTRMLSLLLGAAFAFYEPAMRRWSPVKVGGGGHPVLFALARGGARISADAVVRISAWGISARRCDIATGRPVCGSRRRSELPHESNAALADADMGGAAQLRALPVPSRDFVRRVLAERC